MHTLGVNLANSLVASTKLTQLLSLDRRGSQLGTANLHYSG